MVSVKRRVVERYCGARPGDRRARVYDRGCLVVCARCRVRFVCQQQFDHGQLLSGRRRLPMRCHPGSRRVAGMSDLSRSRRGAGGCAGGRAAAPAAACLAAARHQRAPSGRNTEQVDGRWCTSKAAFRAVGRQLGLTEVGDQYLLPAKAAAARIAGRPPAAGAMPSSRRSPAAGTGERGPQDQDRRR